MTSRIVALGSTSFPQLVLLLARGAFQDGEALDAEQTEALVAGLAAFPHAKLRAFFVERSMPDVDPPVEPGERIAILNILGRMGRGSDMGLVMRLGVPDPALLEPELKAPLQGTVEQILRRHPSAADALLRPLIDGSLDVAAALIQAAGASLSPAALPVLVEVLGREPALDAVLLVQIGILAEVAPKPIDEVLLFQVERYLGSPENQCAREAALACGHAEDFDALAPLIELLEHEDRGVREAALWALERISGQRFRSEAARWGSWLRSEECWFEDDLPRIAAKLSGEIATAVDGLGEIALHRYRRHQLAVEVAPALQNKSAIVRRLACIVLERLGSPVAIPELTERLEDEASVSHAARQALESLGVELPPREEDDADPEGSLKDPFESTEES
jgi:HEAT repeat protein